MERPVRLDRRRKWLFVLRACTYLAAGSGRLPASADCPGRQVADVSADANPATGVATYDSYGESGWLVFGGTSVSAQIIGATYGLAAGTGTLKPSPQTLYPDSGATTGATPGLVPVSSGDNTTSCGKYLYIAADSLSSGYNGPTGLGTPDGLTLLLGDHPPPPTFWHPELQSDKSKR